MGPCRARVPSRFKNQKEAGVAEGRGWVGRKPRDEIEGLWRTGQKEQALYSNSLDCHAEALERFHSILS